MRRQMFRELPPARLNRSYRGYRLGQAEEPSRHENATPSDGSS